MTCYHRYKIKIIILYHIRIIRFLPKYELLGSGNLKKSINLKYTFDLLEQYLTYIEAIRGSAPSTINEYRYDLRMFFDF